MSGTPTTPVGTFPWGARHGGSLAWVNVLDYWDPYDYDDISPAFTRAQAALTELGGGTIYVPHGLYLVYTPIVLTLNGVTIRGDGVGATILQLASGASCDLMSAYPQNINLSGTYGAGPSTALSDFAIRDLTLDGNYPGQTAGPSYPLRFYGYGYTLDNLEVRNGYSGGILCDYYGPYPTTGNTAATNGANNHRSEATWNNVRVHSNLGTTTAIGIEMGGPHDSRLTNVLSYINNSHSFHSGPNNGGLQAVGCHMWQSGGADPNSCSWLQESSLYAASCEAEGSPYAQLVLLGTTMTWMGGAVYSGGAAGLGIQIGQTAGGTPYTNSVNQSAGARIAVGTSSYTIDTLVESITHASGALAFANDAGGVVIARLIASTSTNTTTSGTPAQKTTLLLNNQGYAATVPQQQLLLGGSIAYNPAAWSDPGSNGTISTGGPGVVRIHQGGGAAETGLILQAGTLDGQMVAIVNEGAYAVTFAAAGSHVADGSGDTIAAGTARQFVWSALQGLWYRLQ